MKAEGSIINIKRNSNGDPEMLILSSQKELQDLMSTNISNMHKKNNKKRSKSNPKTSVNNNCTSRTRSKRAKSKEKRL